MTGTVIEKVLWEDKVTSMQTGIDEGASLGVARKRTGVKVGRAYRGTRQ